MDEISFIYTCLLIKNWRVENKLVPVFESFKRGNSNKNVLFMINPNEREKIEFSKSVKKRFRKNFDFKGFIIP